MNATPKAARAAADTSASAKVAPVTKMDSPKAMMTNSWHLSAKCAPSIVHSSVCERPSPGVR